MPRRIERTNREKLIHIGKSIVTAIPGEPSWPAGGPSAAAIQDLVDAVVAARQAVTEADEIATLRRAELDIAMEALYGGIVHVDRITSALYGNDGHQKIAFGLRPYDTQRNSPGLPAVTQVKASDGPLPGTIALRWKAIPRAAYIIEWSADPEFATLLAATIATVRKAVIAGIAPGLQVWIRIRAHRGKRDGAWSAPVTRVAPV